MGTASQQRTVSTHILRIEDILRGGSVFVGVVIRVCRDTLVKTTS